MEAVFAIYIQLDVDKEIKVSARLDNCVFFFQQLSLLYWNAT